MMTPQTSVVPFKFYMCDMSGNFIKELGERFVTCNEQEVPYSDSLLENMEILLEARMIITVEENVYKKENTYFTHTVMFNLRRCLAVARARKGFGPPGSGSG